MSDVLNFNDALNTLEVFKELCVAKVWIPSLQREILIKELSAKQQKTLLSSAVESASEFKSFFIKNLHEILQQNCSEPVETVNSLTFIDYVSIVVALKKQSSNEVIITFESGDEKIEEKISLNSVASLLASIKIPVPEQISVKKDEVEILISPKVPTILDDVTFFDHLPTVKKQENKTENLKQIIAETYMFESAKCIKDVFVANKDLGYDKLSVKQKYALVERLPAFVIQKLLSQYASWKSEVNKSLNVTSSTGLTKQLDVDSILFLTS